MDSDIDFARSAINHLNRFDMRIEFFPLAAPVGTNQRYGELGAAMTANVITFRSRSAFREVGKVFGFDQRSAERPAALASSWEWKGPTDTMENSIKAAGFDLRNSRNRKYLEMAERIQSYRACLR